MTEHETETGGSPNNPIPPVGRDNNPVPPARRDNNPVPPAKPPNASPPNSPKKSRLPIWGLIIVLALAIAFFGFRVFKDARQVNDFIGQIKIFAIDSPTVIETLGEPVEIVEPHQLTTSGNSYKIRFTVKGADGQGEITAIGNKTEIQTSDGKTKTEIVRESMQLVFQGQVIELNPDEELIPEIDIDFGD